MKTDLRFQSQFHWARDAIRRDLKGTESKTCLDTNRITRGNVIDIAGVQIAIFFRSIRMR